MADAIDDAAACPVISIGACGTQNQSFTFIHFNEHYIR